MRTLLAMTAVAVVAAVLGTIRLSAHHSTTMYDSSKPMTVRGTVTQYRWINPHVYISINLDGAAGRPATVWVLEASSPGNLTRLGWSRRSLSANTRVEATFAPMRDGTHAGLCRKIVVLADKTELVCTGAVNAGEKPNLP